MKGRDVALKVLMRVERGGAFAAAALHAELQGGRDARESALATELTLGVLRRRTWLDHLIAGGLSDPGRKLDPKVCQILRIGAYQIAFLESIPKRAAVSEGVNQARRVGAHRACGLVNAVLRRISERKSDELLPDDAPRPELSTEEVARNVGLPTWLFARLGEQLGLERAHRLASVFNEPSRRTLRINAHRAGRDSVALRHTGAVRPGDLSPWSVDVEDPVLARQLVEQGVGAFQDEGSQLVALACGAGEGDKVLDACAGRGGKTAAMLASTQAKARVTATDRAASKLQRMELELEQQGLKAEARVVDWLAKVPEDMKGFDVVLLDAPCTGSGTLGRRPEIRWRLEPRGVEELVDTQRALLDRVAGMVRPGGRLVYAVCSVLKEEGAGQAAAFLERNPRFSFCPDPPASWPDRLPWNTGEIFVDPTITGTDGYQIAVLSRSLST